MRWMRDVWQRLLVMDTINVRILTFHHYLIPLFDRLRAIHDPVAVAFATTAISCPRWTSVIDAGRCSYSRHLGAQQGALNVTFDENDRLGVVALDEATVQRKQARFGTHPDRVFGRGFFRDARALQRHFGGEHDSATDGVPLRGVVARSRTDSCKLRRCVRKIDRTDRHRPVRTGRVGNVQIPQLL